MPEEQLGCGIINILYCGDKNIEDGLIISILSLLKHNANAFNIYVLTMTYDNHEPVTQKCIAILEKLLKDKNPKSSIKLIDATNYFIKEIPTANIDTRFTPYCMLRLYCDMIPEMPDKILYLDNDVVCYNNIKELYDIDITRYEYASHFFKRKWLRRTYINSGVLLMNLKLIKKTGLLKKARKRCAGKKMLLPDQSALNKCATAKLIIDTKYNDQHKVSSDTIFRHFSTTFILFPRIKTQKVKPWEIDKMHDILETHEFDDILEEYLKIKERCK